MGVSYSLIPLRSLETLNMILGNNIIVMVFPCCLVPKEEVFRVARRGVESAGGHVAGGSSEGLAG